MVRSFDPFMILTNQLVTYTSKAKAIKTPIVFSIKAIRTGKSLLVIAAAQRILMPVIRETKKASVTLFQLKSNIDLRNKGTSVIIAI